MLEQLLTRDKIHETDWFARLGGTRDAALRDLKKNFGARAIRDSDLVLLSMTCSNPMDAALVVNEMVDAFLAQQGAATQGQITQRAARMSEQLAMLQRELDVAEQALDDVRRASGFIDLEERNLPEPVVERLIRLDSLADDLELGIAEARAWVQALTKRIADPNSENTPLQEARDELTALTARAEELKQLKDAAAKEKKDFDNARIQFERRAAIRDERLARVNQTKAAIETLRAAQQDPETPQLQFVARAPEPIEISSPRLRRYVPTGAAFGLVVGLIFGALSVLAPVKRRGHIAPL
jgi:hypothetical protein